MLRVVHRTAPTMKTKVLDPFNIINVITINIQTNEMYYKSEARIASNFPKTTYRWYGSNAKGNAGMGRYNQNNVMF